MKTALVVSTNHDLLLGRMSSRPESKKALRRVDVEQLVTSALEDADWPHLAKVLDFTADDLPPLKKRGGVVAASQDVPDDVIHFINRTVDTGLKEALGREVFRD